MGDWVIHDTVHCISIQWEWIAVESIAQGELQIGGQKMSGAAIKWVQLLRLQLIPEGLQSGPRAHLAHHREPPIIGRHLQRRVS